MGTSSINPVLPSLSSTESVALQMLGGTSANFPTNQPTPGIEQPIANVRTGKLNTSQVSTASQSTGVVSTVTHAIASGASTAAGFTETSIERIVIIVIGIALIIAGLFSFRSTHTIIQTGGKVADAIAA